MADENFAFGQDSALRGEPRPDWQPEGALSREKLAQQQAGWENAKFGPHYRPLVEALARLDEADANKRVTSGGDLRFWEAAFQSAQDDIGELIDDLGVVGCARLIAKATNP